MLAFEWEKYSEHLKAVVIENFCEHSENVMAVWSAIATAVPTVWRVLKMLIIEQCMYPLLNTVTFLSLTVLFGK